MLYYIMNLRKSYDLHLVKPSASELTKSGFLYSFAERKVGLECLLWVNITWYYVNITWYYHIQ